MPDAEQKEPGFLVTTVRGGLLVLLPVTGCVLMVVKIYRAAENLLKPIIAFLPFKPLGGVGLAGILTAIVLVLLCFFLGLLVKMRAGKAAGRWLEKAVLNFFPGYQTLKTLSRQLVGAGDAPLGAPALIDLEDNCQIGFIVEELADGRAVIFLPSSPAFTSGNVVIVKTSRVSRLSAPIAKVISSLSKYGVGCARLLDATSKDRSVIGPTA